jgi:hypothetical protein
MSGAGCARVSDRIARLCDGLDAIYEWPCKRHPQHEVLGRARALGVGIGGGCNLLHYPSEIELFGIDLGRRMLEPPSRAIRWSRWCSNRRSGTLEDAPR